ncbi:hypothetical protein [Vibrio algarum]|uniref:Uncharacterized protein n=1 Tax=Vibrio algarum TaxID=3020714 RepID=A0ABT4YSY9_9VIBR|nr:hypothetical protein [Vibrio sp. KJ40-1]MDB1124674.1 hypothetical protein [Vibrio sp. KJ40-1]
MKSKYKAKEGVDFLLDPETSRATFIRNNKAALTHGGYSLQVPETIMQAALDSDLGFEVGLLKGQLTNIATIGGDLMQELYEEGEKAQALAVSLSCADRAARIVPQLLKAVEHQQQNTKGLTTKQKNARKRILKKLQNNSLSALDVAYQFELNELGKLPQFVVDLLQLEIVTPNKEESDLGLDRQQINELLKEYQQTNQREALTIELRKNEVAKVKKRINNSIFSGEIQND